MKLNQGYDITNVIIRKVLIQLKKYWQTSSNE